MTCGENKQCSNSSVHFEFSIDNSNGTYSKYMECKCEYSKLALHHGTSLHPDIYF